MNVEQYAYRPLEGPSWIRIVQLLPAAAREDELKCRILHVNRRISDLVEARSLRYSAVSYVWGVADFSRHILVHEGEESYDMNITPAADCVLRTFRQPQVTVALWIDALCLNQSNEVEKAEQIPLMGEIFSEAEDVLVWLGPEDEHVEDALAILRIFALGGSGERTGRASYGDEVSGWVRTLASHSSAEHLPAINKLFTRTLFKRRWILQELALGQSVVVYAHTTKIRLPSLQLGLANWDHWTRISKNPSLDTPARQAMEMILRLPSRPRSLLRNLWDFHLSECSDPRDNVRALLGLSLNFADPADFEPILNGINRKGVGLSPEMLSYTAYGEKEEHLPPLARNGIDRSSVEVFADMAAYFARHHQFADILQHVLAFGACDETADRCSSWTPDWSRQRIHGRDQQMLQTLLPPLDSSMSPRWDLQALEISPQCGSAYFVSRARRIAFAAPPASSISDCVSVLQHLTHIFGRSPEVQEIQSFSVALCAHIFTLQPALLQEHTIPGCSLDSVRRPSMKEQMCVQLTHHLVEMARDSASPRASSDLISHDHPLLSRLLEEAEWLMSTYTLFVAENSDLVEGWGFCRNAAVVGDLLIPVNCSDHEEGLSYLATLHLKPIGAILTSQLSSVEGGPLHYSRQPGSSAWMKTMNSSMDSDAGLPFKIGWTSRKGGKIWYHTPTDGLPANVSDNIDYIMDDLCSDLLFQPKFCIDRLNGLGGANGYVCTLQGVAFMFQDRHEKHHLIEWEYCRTCEELRSIILV